MTRPGAGGSTTLRSDPACKVAFKDNQWNKYRVEANGDRIRTWVNGVPCADLVDSMDLTGFIALQVHAYKGEKPAEVRWRNIRIEDNGRHEWKPVFNGASLEGWKHSGGGLVQSGEQERLVHATSAADNERYRHDGVRMRRSVTLPLG